MIPDTLIRLRFEIISTLMLAAGVPIAMLKSSEQSSVYEAGYRVFIFNTTGTYGRLIETTLVRETGDTDISLNLDSLAASTIQVRARSVRQLVDSGMAVSNRQSKLLVSIRSRDESLLQTNWMEEANRVKAMVGVAHAGKQRFGRKAKKT